MLSVSRQGRVSTLHNIATLILLCGGLMIAAGCGSSTLNQSAQNAAAVQLSIAPRTAMLAPNSEQQFTATVQGTSNSAVSWLASAGSISSDGKYTAPPTNSALQIAITATSLADSSQRATSVVTIQPSGALKITTPSLAGAVVNTPYGADLSASGGAPPYQWTISQGSLPPGIQMLSTAGQFSGVPTQKGTYSVSVKVTDAAKNSATQPLSLTVSVSTTGNYDGPAELPRVYLQTMLADTPASGSTISVNSGGDLQTALNNANCGDTVELQAGATFTSKVITLPAKACDNQHWIIVRTSTPDANLPPEGTRMTPCYAGVPSLPGRPIFPCTKPQKLLATITYTGTGSGPILFANGANHYRLLGLEITRAVKDGMDVTALVGPEQFGAMNQIVLDRMYIHGTPADETRRGVELSGGTGVAVQDSYLSDFHCAVGGSCSDSQAVSGGTGTLATGPLRIVDNYLEAAGENIIFGGGAATQTPADIEIRLNHLFKPLFWLQGQAGFAAPAVIVKNHFELKNAQRVLFDSNILEDTWGGFSQEGYSVVITPKNQASGGTNVCPLCQVTDVTVRNITISHVAGVFQIANAIELPNGAALQGQRYSIHDVIADDIDGVKYMGYGNFAQVSTIAVPLLQSVLINHVTAFAPHELFNVGAPNTVKMPGFAFTNSIVTSGVYPLWSTGSFGLADCAKADVPLTVMEQCFSGYSFSFNAILDAPAEYSPSTWPADNWFYSSAAMNFVSFNNGNGGDYHLLPSSPAKAMASDGTDLGANIDAVLTAISGVR